MICTNIDVIEYTLKNYITKAMRMCVRPYDDLILWYEFTDNSPIGVEINLKELDLRFNTFNKIKGRIRLETNTYLKRIYGEEEAIRRPLDKVLFFDSLVDVFIFAEDYPAISTFCKDLLREILKKEFDEKLIFLQHIA